MEERFIRSLTG